MLTTFYPPYHFGGDATYVRALARGLTQLGHEVEVVHCEDAYRLKRREAPEVVGDDGVRVHRLRSRFGSLSPLISQQLGRPGLKGNRLKRILDRNFDVIHFHNISLLGGPAVLSWGRAPVKLYTLHEHWLLCPTHVFWKNGARVCDRQTCFTCSIRSKIPPQLWRYSSLRDRSLENVDLLISPSNYTAQRHAAGGVKAPIRVLPLFSDLDPGQVALSEQPARPQFVFVGRVTRSKGIVELLKVFAGLPEYDLVVVGAGDLLSSLRLAYADQSNILFLGRVPQHEIVETYQSATAVVLPTLVPETFGLTIVEALACSTPVIVRESGGSPEIVEQSGAGIVYRSDTDLEAALHRFANDAALVEEMRTKARLAYERHYTRAGHLAAYVQIVESVAGQKRVIPS